jgi:deaminated glutathione amidase
MGQFDVPPLTDDRQTLSVACVQLVSGLDRERNLEQARIGVAQAAARGSRLVVLPEKWNVLGDAAQLQAGAEAIDGPTISAVREWARSHDLWICAGSFVERVEGQDRLSNTSLLIDPSGEIRARYTKIHMFDVEVGGVAYRESDSSQGGTDLVVSPVDDVPLGMTVCYDLRFPELYRILALIGARIITVPAAFTMFTGRDHWEVLLRARAIENQCFVVAASIIGDPGDGKVSYGRSMIVDPWGVVLAQAADAECVITAELDLTAVDRVRASLPSLASRVPDAYRWPR